MNLQLSTPSLAELQQQAEHHLDTKAYPQAEGLYEQLIEEDPSFRAGYWYLGLCRLLQGEESDAQVIWLMAMSEGEPEEVTQWTQELLQVLQAEANRQEDWGEDQTAWMIRQCLRGIEPDDISNLLLLLQLHLKLEQLTESELADLNLIQLLRSQPVLEVDRTLLWNLLQQLLDWGIESPLVAEFVEASLPYADNPNAWVAVLLSKAVILAKLFLNNTLACRYGELCLQLDPYHSETLLRLASFYQDENRFAEGIEVAKRYFAGCQTLLQKLMGNALVLRGLMATGSQWQEAEATLQQETQLLQAFIEEAGVEPSQFLCSSMMCTPVFFYPYFGDRPDHNRPLQNQLSHLYETGLNRYIEQTAADYKPYSIATPKRISSRKTLRIGYLSRCMRRHSVGWLSRWVFQHFDRDRFEVYAYFNQQAKIDPFSQRWFASQATRACRFEGESDFLGLAKAIQEDEIDILVDLDSITADYTCGVMALKPAPIQVTWLGLDATGLPAIDYFLADPYVLPDNAQDYYAETIWRLPQTYIAVDGFEAGVPTLRRDHLDIPSDAVTYLSSQFAYKRNPEMVRLQMRILREVSNSYFLVKGAGDQEGLRAYFTQMADEEGVSRDRLRFLPIDWNEETHRANLKIADVVLDTFPYNGATTTLETLWMGIPLVTRVGQQFAARNSYTMMVNAGITEGIAWTDEEYVEWGIRLGEDAALREQISWKLWRSRQTAPLWNARQFTRDLEGAYTKMWEIYQNKA